MEYVSRVLLDINGLQITDFQSVEEPEEELHKPVKLMHKTGHITTTPRYDGISVEYVVPTVGEFDFRGVVNGRLSIEYENGTRVNYLGVYVTKIGKTKFDGDKEAVRQIEFSAEQRVVG